MFIKLIRVALLFMAFTLPGFFAQAGNIVSGDSAANLDIDNTDVYFVCDGCDVTVTDTEVDGLIWGESLGWVNLQPSDGGVFNTRLGEVTGNAWGSISGWVNFTGVFIDPETGEFSGQAFSQNRGPIVFECPGSDCVITTWRPIGCTNPAATNYDYTATVDDGSCLVPEDPPVSGCTDPEANNYSRLAEIDDGSCTYDAPDPDPEDPVDNPGGGGETTDIPGCTDPEANNYNEFATINDSSCLYGADILGCMDPDSIWFNPEATISDPSACVIDSYGCTDPEALNYNPLVTISNDSCIYQDSAGCMDPLALNYNPTVIISDGSCVYDTPGNGCTDPLALNYNPAASIDNGTCLYQTDFEDLPIDLDGDGEFDILPSEEVFDDTNNDSIPDVLQGGQELIESLLDSIPGKASDFGKILNNYFATKSGASKAITLALLIGSILQTLPFREGNLLFSFFSFYRTRKYWGTVYDSVTKQPLDPAYVTLFDEAGQAIDTSITDIDGRYSFTVSPGKYFLSAQKTDYQFPSQKLEGKHYDEIYSHLYFGGEVVVEEQDGIISKNIPMDPLRFNWNEYAKQKTRVTHFYKPWHRTLNAIAKILFLFGFVFAVWVFAVSPSVFSFVILSLYIVTTLIKIMGLMKATPRGYVKDKEGFAVPFAIIRVYSETLKREVKHTIVGGEGHYLLLVPNGHYHMTVEQKLHDGSYKEIYKTSAFKVRKGYIAKKLTVTKIVEVGEEKFDAMFLSESHKKMI